MLYLMSAVHRVNPSIYPGAAVCRVSLKVGSKTEIVY